MRSIKKNVLKPFLFVCLGLAIATIAFASVRSFSPPSSPGRPEAVEILDDRCILSYLAPMSDGGFRVTNYIIEGKPEESDRWTIKGTSKYLHFYVNSGIVKGSTHIFRVSAENAMGLSAPSKNSNPVTFENPF